MLAASQPASSAPLGSPQRWVELAPLVHRVAGRDAATPVRLRHRGARSTVLAHLSTGTLVGRTVETADHGEIDVTLRAGELRAWLDGERSELPPRADAQWRGGLPPATGWRRIDRVPDAVVRDLIRQGAQAHADAAGRQLGTRAAEALLDAVVLTVQDGSGRAEITNRALSAVTAMGFLPRGSYVAIDVAGRWNRIAAPYGSVFAERPGATLDLLN